MKRIVLFLLLFSLLLTACSTARAEEAPKPENFLDELTFLGDSITAHMAQRAEVRKEQVLATKNRYLNLDPRILSAKLVAPDTGEEECITDLVARLRPRYLVITLGVDYGVYYYRNRPDSFRLCYEKLLTALTEASPNTKLVLQSVFPVARSSKTVKNEMIKSANEVICAIAAERGLPFIDQYQNLADTEGYLPDEYCSSEDGIHLTEAAYKQVLSLLQKEEAKIRGNL